MAGVRGGVLAIVMAGGDGTRWTGECPKCVAPVLGEPVIRRTARMLSERGIWPIVVSHKPEVAAALEALPAEVFGEREPYYLNFVTRLADRRQARNVVLFGDVAYTDGALDAVLDAPGPMWWIGHCPEMFGMLWEDRGDAWYVIRRCIWRAPWQPGKLRGRIWNCYHEWSARQMAAQGKPIQPVHWDSVAGCYTDIDDETGDMDTVEAWHQVAAAFEGRR